MEKPTKMICNDGSEKCFKEVCIFWEAKFAWLDGEKYVLPIEKLTKEKA